MKTLVRTIALIAVISLSCACFSGEPEENAERARLEAQKLLQKQQENEQAKLQETLRDLTRQREELERNQEQLRRQLMELDRQVEVTMPTPATPPVPAATRTSGIVLASRRAGDSADISVVITSKDGQPESISQVTEDMGIMARILDKQVLEIPRPQPRQTTFGDMSFYYVQTGAAQSNQTRGIYISGYGALFLMDVDFPLKPEPKTEEKEEKKAEVPDMWERTKGELKGWYQGPGAVEPDIVRVKRKAAFDKSKVEELKEKIINSLKYASNIRGLEPGDDIIVSVKSIGLQGSETRRDIRILNRQSGAQSGGGGFGGGYGGAFAEEEPEPITGMTIIVNKGDVDKFAEGDMDYEKFCEDVEIIEY